MATLTVEWSYWHPEDPDVYVVCDERRARSVAKFIGGKPVRRVVTYSDWEVVEDDQW